MEQLKDLLQQEGLLAEIFTKNILTPATLNYLQDNDPQKAFDYLINKIAKHIRNQVISKDMDFEAKRKALKEMVSDQYIKWDISVLSDDLKYVADRFLVKLKGHTLEDLYQYKYDINDFYIFKYMPESPILPALTSMKGTSLKNVEGSYTLRKRNGGTTNHFYFLDLSQRLAYIMLYNAMQSYILSNKERVEYVFQKTFDADKVFDCEKGTFFTLENLCFVLPIYHKHSLSMGRLKTFCVNLFRDMCGIAESIQNYIYARDITERTYAASYQLKKNIPQATLKKMKETYLNEYFSEIEIDEEMNLDKFKEVEEEYKKVINMFPTQKIPSLRFRRLGKYKAGGLYFPYHKAICVDIKQVSSMIHELMHWLDYNYYYLIGNTEFKNSYRSRLSSSIRFCHLVDMYKQIMNNQMNLRDSEDPIKKQWFGTTKYNRSYYFDTSEIFARLGVLYFYYKFGDILILSTEGIGHPKDEELKEYLMKFFDDVFDEIKIKENVTAVSNFKNQDMQGEKIIASYRDQSTNKNTIFINTDQEQLSLF